MLPLISSLLYEPISFVHAGLRGGTLLQKSASSKPVKTAAEESAADAGTFPHDEQVGVWPCAMLAGYLVVSAPYVVR